MYAFKLLTKTPLRTVTTIITGGILSRPILKWPTKESDGIDNPFYSNLCNFHADLVHTYQQKRKLSTTENDADYTLSGPFSIFNQRQLQKSNPIVTRTFADLKYDFSSPKDRHEQINQLANEQFDVLVIGGGIVGTAAAVEANKRGFNVALIDKNDFAACTSSRSTKLIHGGVRYLEQAFTQLDPSMLALVKEALNERSHMLKAAPYMNKPLPIIIPLDSYWQLPYMYIGTKLYEFFAPKDVPKTHLMSREQTLTHFPNMDLNKFKLIGSIVYYDGQTNDSRLTLSLALTAEQNGATVANYVEFKDFIKDDSGNIIGAKLYDHISGQYITTKTHSVVNAAGPFADQIRKLDDPNSDDLIIPVAGIHIAMKQDVASPEYGFLVPKTPDNRVLFLLPWEQKVIAGTTDAPSELTDVPTPAIGDIQYILQILNSYMKDTYTLDDVQSVWAGLRPLVRDVEALQKAKSSHVAGIKKAGTQPTSDGNVEVKAPVTTSKLSRHHVVLTSPSGLVSVMGGKLTTHRQMAEDTIDALFESVPFFKQYNDMLITFQKAEYESQQETGKHLPPFVPKEHYLTKSNTFNQPIYGADDLSRLTGAESYGALEALLESTYHIDRKTSESLVQHFGTRALAIATNTLQQCPVNPTTNKVDAECIAKVELDYMIHYEMPQHVEDIIFRRHRTGFLDTDATLAVSEDVLTHMADKFKWDEQRKDDERQRVHQLLDKMAVSRLFKRDTSSSTSSTSSVQQGSACPVSASIDGAMIPILPDSGVQVVSDPVIIHSHDETVSLRGAQGTQPLKM